MIENAGDPNAASVLQSDSHSHSEDADFSVNEVDVDHGSQSMDLPVVDVCNTTTIAVTMTNSNHVHIKPVTQINGPVTIHQYPKPEPHVGLTTSRKKICHAMLSSLTWKAGLVLTLIVASIVVVIILNFTVPRQDSGQGTRPATQRTKLSPAEPDTNLGDDIHIFTKKRWGGQEIANQYGILSHPTPLVIIGHTGERTGKGTTFEDCSLLVQDVQSMVVDKRKWADIPYNFLIAGDGNVYEALGWDTQNPRHNNSLWISFVGNYVYLFLDERQEKALHLLLKKGIELEKLDTNYSMIAHRQFLNTISPGKNIIDAMQPWPHYDNRTYT